MNSRTAALHDEQDDRSSQAQLVITDCMRRRISGESLSDDQIIASHPDLMPELGEGLRKLALIERAVRTGRGASSLPAAEAPERRAEGPPRPDPHSFPGYEITGDLHRGGQGVVYRAVHKATKRKVAIKVMKEGPFAGPADKARFEREVQILGQLNHPNIVTIHDSGEAAGHFYYTMDYISGQPLDEYMADGQRSIDETLRLFAKICDAVNAAHLRGVIHRDLKPGNIRIDANGEPYILDFGLAKVATGDADAALMTMTGQFVGSLPWASPEQAEGSPSKIDIRTDVYSLGVILYRILTGEFPYQVIGNMRDVLDRILRAEPVRPSTIRRQINDEVETIVLKCLSKERERRYQSAGELARDVRHYLAREPIEAKRDSIGYLLGKQLRRYRLPVAITAVFVVVVTVGFIVSLTFWTQAATERDRAWRAEQEQTRERVRAETVSEFLQDMLASVEPGGSFGREVTVREVLDEAARKLAGDSLEGQPHVNAVVHSTIGKAYQALGLYDAAEPHLRAAVEICEQYLGEEHVHVAASLGNLALLLRAKGDHVEAEALLRRALALERRLLGDEHPDVATGLSNLALVRQARGDYVEAEALLRRALALGRRSLGDEHPTVAVRLNNLAMLLRDRGDYAQAEPLLRDVLAMRRRLLGNEHPMVLQSLNNLAILLTHKGEYAEAMPLYREALELRRELLGDEHPDVATSLNNLAVLLRRTGEYAEAETLYREALAMRRKLLGDDHPDVAETLNNLGVLLRRQGRLSEARTLYRDALPIWRKLLGDDHPDVATALNNLAQVLKAQRHYDEAERLHREALAVRRKALGEDHPSVAESLNNLGVLLQAKGDYEGAEPLLRQALQIRRAALPPDHRRTLTTLANLGDTLVKQQKFAEAEPLLRECLAAPRSALPGDNLLIASATSILGASLAGQGEFEEAQPLLLEGYALIRDHPQAPPERKTEALERIVQLYEAWNQPEQAAEWRARLPTTQPHSQPTRDTPSNH